MIGDSIPNTLRFQQPSICSINTILNYEKNASAIASLTTQDSTQVLENGYTEPVTSVTGIRDFPDILGYRT